MAGKPVEKASLTVRLMDTMIQTGINVKEFASEIYEHVSPIIGSAWIQIEGPELVEYLKNKAESDGVENIADEISVQNQPPRLSDEDAEYIAEHVTMAMDAITFGGETLASGIKTVTDKMMDDARSVGGFSDDVPLEISDTLPQNDPLSIRITMFMDTVEELVEKFGFNPIEWKGIAELEQRKERILSESSDIFGHSPEIEKDFAEKLFKMTPDEVSSELGRVLSIQAKIKSVYPVDVMSELYMSRRLYGLTDLQIEQQLFIANELKDKSESKFEQRMLLFFNESIRGSMMSGLFDDVNSAESIGTLMNAQIYARGMKNKSLESIIHMMDSILSGSNPSPLNTESYPVSIVDISNEYKITGMGPELPLPIFEDNIVDDDARRVTEEFRRIGRIEADERSERQAEFRGVEAPVVPPNPVQFTPTNNLLV